MIEKELEYADVCVVHPVKGFWPFRKGSINKKPYYVYMIYDTVNYSDGKRLELVSHIPDMSSCIVNEYLLKRMEFIGNLKTNPGLWEKLLKQDIK
jgi:hypothetical protein